MRRWKPILALSLAATTVLGGGTWQALPAGGVRQSDPTAGIALADVRATGDGPAWRCTVIPGFRDAAAGVVVGGLSLALEAGDGSAGLVLRQAPDGEVIWADDFLNWQPYEAVRIECVTAPGKLYVQALSVARGDLLAQSEWLECTLPDAIALTPFTRTMTAEFQDWGSFVEPLWPPDPNSPSKLRLLQHGDSSWAVVGGGDWRWTDATRTVLRQARKTERTKAYLTRKRAPEGTWRCRLKLDKGTCGGGMMVLSDPEEEIGFICWLGGTYGNGSLMLYRKSGTCVWASRQGQWHWDTEYVVEADVGDGTIVTRLLAADGVQIAASPEVPLTPEEQKRPAMIGLHVWRGTGMFWDFSDATRVGTAPPPAEATPLPGDGLGEGFRIINGDWQWQDGESTHLACVGAPPGQVVATTVRGSRGVFSCDVEPGDGARSVSLLFQVGGDGKLGFECRLGDGCELRSLAGETLWRDPAFALKPGTRYRVEGRVITDRVLLRVLDAEGKELVTSLDCYVSDTNNDRVGAIGFAATGPAVFSNWVFTAAE